MHQELMHHTTGRANDTSVLAGAVLLYAVLAGWLSLCCSSHATRGCHAPRSTPAPLSGAEAQLAL